MKLKKIFTVILMLVVILSLSASYLLMGFTPPQPAPAEPQAVTQEPVSDFKGPTTPPSVKGPTSPPPGQ